MKKPFVNSFTYLQVGDEINTGSSMTQPEMTMSLKTLLDRYTRGGEVATFTPVYHGSGEFDDNPEFEKMDPTEKLQYALDIKMAIKRHQNQPKAEQTPPASKEAERSQSEKSEAAGEAKSSNPS